METPATRHCEHCGRAYEVRRSGQKYCTKKCRDNAKKSTLENRLVTERTVWLLDAFMREDGLSFSEAADMCGRYEQQKQLEVELMKEGVSIGKRGLLKDGRPLAWPVPLIQAKKRNRRKERMEKLAEKCQALGNPTRLAILQVLMECPDIGLKQLQDELGVAQSSLYGHLAKMCRSGLVAQKRRGASVAYAIANPDDIEGLRLLGWEI